MQMEFLWGGGHARYWKILEDLYNDYVKGSDPYPKTFSGAYSLLTNYMQYKLYISSLGGETR